MGKSDLNKLRRQRDRVMMQRDQVASMQYTEPRVDVIRFIEDPYYLGLATNKGKDIYPCWKEALEEAFYDNRHIQIVFSGAIGTGKTTAAVLGMLYVLYTHLCMKDPWAFYRKDASGKLSLSFFNLNKTLGGSRGFEKLQSFMKRSRWFYEHKSRIIRGKKDQYMEFPNFKYLLASPLSQGFGVVGEDIVCGLMDEVDNPVESAARKGKVLQAYDATIRRFKSRFLVGGQKSLGRLFLVSSKSDDLAFLENFVLQMKKSGNPGEVVVFDIPLWKARPKGAYSGPTFPVAIGDSYRPSKMLNDTEVDEYRKNGFTVIDVPVEHRSEFELDIVGALRDIAGVAVSGTRRRKLFSSVKFVRDCFDADKPDPFSMETIEMGLQDPEHEQLMNYFDAEAVRLPKTAPRFIHEDISFSGDALGLSMAGISGYVDSELEREDGSFEQVRLPIIETDFAIRIKAKDGDRIPLNKVRKFILQLRAIGFNIRRFTADLRLASEDTRQILEKRGIETEYLSLDRTDKPYTEFRNLVYDKRWVCHKLEYLLLELENLEVDPQTGKVDHPDTVRTVVLLQEGGTQELVLEGSKDLSDATVGAVISCLNLNKVPVDREKVNQLMSKVVARQAEPPQKSAAIKFRDSKGREIIGTTKKQPPGQRTPNQNPEDKYKKMTDLLRRLR